MSCESKPDVISTPIQHRKSHRYMRRRFRFLYHGTLSSAAKRVTIGSAVVPTFTILTASVRRSYGVVDGGVRWCSLAPAFWTVTSRDIKQRWTWEDPMQGPIRPPARPSVSGSSGVLPSSIVRPAPQSTFLVVVRAFNPIRRIGPVRSTIFWGSWHRTGHLADVPWHHYPGHGIGPLRRSCSPWMRQ